MTEDAIAALQTWVIREGLSGLSESALLDGFCAACRRGGVPLARALVIIDTLHPVFEGRAFRWRADGAEEKTVVDYAPTTQGEAATNWQQSVFYHLSAGGDDEFRGRLAEDPSLAERFPGLKTMREEGLTDYLAFIQRFSQAGSIGEMDCRLFALDLGRPGRLRRRGHRRRSANSSRRWRSP